MLTATLFQVCISHLHVMDSHSRLTRVTAEVGSDEQIADILDNPSDHHAYVGYEPSGVLHLGHLLTAQKLADLHQIGLDVTVLMADVHAHINGKGSLEHVREVGEEMAAHLRAFGLQDAEVVYGSSFQYDESYQNALHQLQTTVSLSRAERSMSEIAGDGTPTVGSVVYPLMQALDIAALDADIAVGGMEQRKVHMLARDALPSIGEEKPAFVHTPLISDLKTGSGKMSSSEGVTLSAADTEQDVRQKVSDAFCPQAIEQEGSENPVLQLYEYLVFPRNDLVTVDRPSPYGGTLRYNSYSELEQSLVSGNLHPADAKDTLAAHLNNILEPIRQSKHD